MFDSIEKLVLTSYNSGAKNYSQLDDDFETNIQEIIEQFSLLEKSFQSSEEFYEAVRYCYSSGYEDQKENLFHSLGKPEQTVCSLIDNLTERELIFI